MIDKGILRESDSKVRVIFELTEKSPNRLDLRLAEAPTPRLGDRIEIDGEPFLIQGEPARDRERRS